MIEDRYTLSPMQHGMLLQSIAAPQAGVYVAQTVCEFPEGFEPASFHQTWNTILQRHTVLRTSFDWTADPAKQVVWSSVDLPWLEEDWREIPDAERPSRLRGFPAAV